MKYLSKYENNVLCLLLKINSYWRLKIGKHKYHMSKISFILLNFSLKFHAIELLTSFSVRSLTSTRVMDMKLERETMQRINAIRSLILYLTCHNSKLFKSPLFHACMHAFLIDRYVIYNSHLKDIIKERALWIIWWCWFVTKTDFN